MLTMFCSECHEEEPLHKLYGCTNIDTPTVPMGTYGIFCVDCLETILSNKFYAFAKTINRNDISGYSLTQVVSIMLCANCDLADAKEVCDYMDAHNEHPDWSEATWVELSTQINTVFYELMGSETHYKNYQAITETEGV